MTQIILMADLQPDANTNGPDQLAFCQAILSEISTYFPNATHGVFPGDIVDRGHPDRAEMNANGVRWINFRDMKMLFDATGLEWEFIAGNHDHDYRVWFQARPSVSLWEYSKVFGANQKIFNVGNIRFIMMGDEESNTAGVISPATHQWWLDEMAKAATDGVSPITCTHQTLEGTLNENDSWPHKHFDTSALFQASLEAGIKPDAWLSGHHGADQLTDADERHVIHEGIPFCNVGVHVPTCLEASTVKDGIYKVLDVTNGSTTATVSAWNHTQKQFEPDLGFTFQLSVPYSDAA